MNIRKKEYKEYKEYIFICVKNIDKNKYPHQNKKDSNEELNPLQNCLIYIFFYISYISI